MVSQLTRRSGDVELGGVADGYGNLLVKEGSFGIAQLDLVVARSKRELLGLIGARRITAVDVDLNILAVRVDLHLTIVGDGVSRRIRVVAVVGIPRAIERP